jgi:tetratricopeptide (TPR) repeat protein
MARVEGMPPGVVSPTTLRLLAASLGSESPLPPFTGLQRLPDPSASASLPPDMRERIEYGRLANPLPYALQNDYSRDLRSRDIPALRITNDRLEALVLPGLGGRLWSLRDLAVDRDLLFTNRSLQFANFALTDAWFAGGIEWNLGSTGHSATTCRPVFTGSVSSSRGAALRIWEWERTRDLVFSVDLLMPADRALLLAFVRIRNPDPEPKPLYWWTNIAVPEEPGVRVLAPATQAWRTTYDGSIASVEIPFADHQATDISYPLSAQGAADYFFQVSTERRPWIAAVQADGRGLVQTSTAQLRGRKLFLWGTAAGGQHWQEWLCGPESRYLEIQAGLATTQLEHLRLDGGAEISWAEAYAPIVAAPTAVHGSWPDALADVTELVALAIPDEELSEWHRWWRTEVADAAPQQITAGSGAGEAEILVRGKDPDGLPGTPFGQPLSDGFRHLVALARTGEVDQDAAGAEVLVPPTTDRWEAVLDRAAEGWWGQLMLAIRSHARGDLEEARLGYLRSAKIRSTPWAARGLAQLAVARGDHAGAADLYARAVAQAPSSLPLLVEATDQLLNAGRSAACLAMIDAAPDRISAHGRVVLQRIRALLAVGRVDDARALLETGIEVPDLREGETLETLWQAAYGDRPLPYRYDFRMRPDLEQRARHAGTSRLSR